LGGGGAEYDVVKKYLYRVITFNKAIIIKNFLTTKRKPDVCPLEESDWSELYIKTQSVPRSKHTPSRL
jgi:hypothetical protein